MCSSLRTLALAVTLVAAAGTLAAALPGQPFASYWHPNTLLNWNPATDPDAPFNRANTPLAPRTSNPALNVNPNARTNQGRIASLSAFAPTSGNPSQGGLSMTYYAHGFWQYEDVLVFWGGSAGEGLILAPNATVIDAAHRNGVRVLGNVFFPPTAYGGQIQWVNDFLQKSGNTFPVADKMIQVAQHYGFDGWFLNQETAGGNSTTATTMRAFIKYMRTNSSLQVMWYDAMTESGAVSWQNALTANNDMFLHDGGPVSHEMFLNFWWSSTGLANSRTRAQSYGRSPYDLYAGVDVEANGYNTSVGWTSMFPAAGAHVVSIGFYRPDWCYRSSSGASDFVARETRFWVGPGGDPSSTSSADAWPGMAHFVAAKTPVTKVPFVTSFNTGQGNRYAINGQTLMTGNWNNLSVQDVLPTWRWLVKSSGTKLTPSLDWSDAYHGGTSLRVTGALNATNDLLLYQASLPVSNNTSLRITYKSGSSGANTYMKVAVAFEDSVSSYVYLNVPATTNANWNTHTFNLAPYAGRKIAVIGLRFDAPSAIASYNMRVGQLAVYHGAISTPAEPSNVVVDQTSAVDDTTATVRLKWTHSTNAVYCYNVYRRNADASRTWLGATPNNAYFVPQVKRTAGEAYVPIEVEAVALDFGVSGVATAAVPWPAVLVSAGSVWKYNDTGSGAALGTAWRAPAFNDSAWPSGPAMLGYGDADGRNPATTNSFGPDANNKYIATYYRRAFVAEDPASYSRLTLSVQRDDGAVVYLNGVEVFRSNMPAGAVNYLTAASSAVSGGDEAAFYSTNLNSSVLVAGTNVLAVEVHQNNGTSSDLAFDLSLSAQLNAAPVVTITWPTNNAVLDTDEMVISASATDLDGGIARVEFYADGTLLGQRTAPPYSVPWSNISTGFHSLSARAIDLEGRAATNVVEVIRPGVATFPVAFIPANALWRYNDLGNDLGTTWRANNFNDASWPSGVAELGFGDGSDGRPEATVIVNRSQITFYFRRTFNVPNASLVGSLSARLIRDDGAIVYLNGVEVWRDNLPAGPITAATPALTAIGGADEYTWLTATLPRSALVSGTNVVAVEIHQQSTSSSDVSFNFELMGSAVVPEQPRIEMSVATSSLTVTWPGDAGLFRLFTAAAVDATSWAPVAVTPVWVNDQWSVTVPLSTNVSARFFRLGR